MNTIDNLLFFNKILGTGILFLEIVLIFILLFLIYYKNSNQLIKTKINNFIDNKIIFLDQLLASFNFKLNLTVEKLIIFKIFIIALLTSVGTLIYSEMFAIPPCALCWFSRVFMYGITIITGIAIFSRTVAEIKLIYKYIFTFSIFGLFFASYHTVLQFVSMNGGSLPCPTSGSSCDKIVLFEYAHITLPYSAFVIFSTFIIMIIFYKIVYTTNVD